MQSGRDQNRSKYITSIQLRSARLEGKPNIVGQVLANDEQLCLMISGKIKTTDVTRKTIRCLEVGVRSPSGSFRQDPEREG